MLRAINRIFKECAARIARSRGGGEMKKDPAIEEIRAVRRKISQKYGNDSKALVAHYIELQKKYADRLVAAPSRARSTTIVK